MDDVNWGWVFTGVMMIMTGANILYTWISQAKLARDQDVKSHGERLTAIEAQVRAMPSSHDFHKMQLEMGVMGQQMKTIAATMGRVEQFLMEHSVKGRSR